MTCARRPMEKVSGYSCPWVQEAATWWIGNAGVLVGERSAGIGRRRGCYLCADTSGRLPNRLDARGRRRRDQSPVTGVRRRELITGTSCGLRAEPARQGGGPWATTLHFVRGNS